MVLMEDWLLSCLPFSMSVRKGRVLGENSGQVPIEEVWIIDQGLSMEWLIVVDERSTVL